MTRRFPPPRRRPPVSEPVGRFVRLVVAVILLEVLALFWIVNAIRPLG